MEKRIDRKSYLNQLVKWREKEMIKVVTGVRRCGKSTLFSIYIDFLKSEGISEEQIVYVNLEDLDYSELLDDRSLHEYIRSRLLEDQWTYVFIDEVQNCKDYERAISSLFLKKRTDIYLTGSNAYMLSGELATKLSGRYVEIDMLPLSFSEFSEAVDVTEPRERFNLFMNMGAFPYAASLIDQSLVHDQYLEGIYNTVLVKDVLMHKSLGDAALLKSIARFLADNVGNPVSAKKIADTLKTNGFKSITADTVGNYLEYLCESFLFYKVYRYDIKGKEYLKTLNKYYISDVGLRNAKMNYRQVEVTHALENIVYLELIRRGYTVDIGKNNAKEIDFIASDNHDSYYIQVAYSITDPAKKEQELSSFKNIDDGYKKIVITMDDDPFTLMENGYRKINAITFLLNADSLRTL